MLALLRRLMSARATWFTRIPSNRLRLRLSHSGCIRKGVCFQLIRDAAVASESPLSIHSGCRTDNSRGRSASDGTQMLIYAWYCSSPWQSPCRLFTLQGHSTRLHSTRVESSRMHPPERNWNVLIYGCNWASGHPRWRHCWKVSPGTTLAASESSIKWARARSLISHKLVAGTHKCAQVASQSLSKSNTKFAAGREMPVA